MKTIVIRTITEPRLGLRRMFRLSRRERRTQAVPYLELAARPGRLADAEGVCDDDAGGGAEHADRHGGAQVGGGEGGGEVGGAGHQSGGEQQDLPLPQAVAVSHRRVQLGGL